MPSDSQPGSELDRRVALRAAVDISADLRKPGRTPFKITIRDLSRTGCRAETLTKTRIDDRIWITLPDFAPIEGVIRWSNSRGFGAEWVKPIHASVFDHIRTRHPTILS